MSYMTAQGLVKTMLLTNTNFSADDVTESNIRPLDMGRTNIAVLWPGTFDPIDLESMTKDRGWTVLVDLFTKFSGETSYSAIGTLRDSVIATIEAGRALSSTLIVVGIEADGDPQEVFDRQSAGPFFVVQRMRLNVTEFI